MPNASIGAPVPGTDVVTRAVSILMREAASLAPLPGGGAGSLAPAIAPPALPGSGDGPTAPNPQVPGELERLRRQAHALIDDLLALVSPRSASLEDRVPLVWCKAPVAAGQVATATIRLANDEPGPVEVTLYCTNFVADSGYDIPSLRVSCSPRRATIPPKGESTFEIGIAVPQQTPAGAYSGLIQATGSRYVKAVVSVEVT